MFKSMNPVRTLYHHFLLPCITEVRHLGWTLFHKIVKLARYLTNYLPLNMAYSCEQLASLVSCPKVNARHANSQPPTFEFQIKVLFFVLDAWSISIVVSRFLVQKVWLHQPKLSWPKRLLRGRNLAWPKKPVINWLNPRLCDTHMTVSIWVT